MNNNRSNIYNEAESPDTLLTPQTTAARLGVTERQLAVWRYQGRGPAFVKLSHKKVRYRVSDLNEWVSSRVRTQSSREAY